MSMLKNLLRWVRIIKPGVDDPDNFHIQQISYLGKTAETLMLFPYGLHGNVPEDALGLMFSIQNNTDNRATIAWVPKGRPKLKGGEVAFYHPPTDAFIIWRENGDLDIESGNQGAANINIKAALTTIDGDLTVTGFTRLSEDVTSDGTDISNSHVHSQGVDSDGDSQVNTDPPV